MTFCIAANIFKLYEQVLDVLAPGWRRRQIGVSTDGENKMTGCNSGVATLMERACLPGFVRVWCGPHQADIPMQTFYASIMDGAFKDQLTAIIGKTFCC